MLERNTHDSVPELHQVLLKTTYNHRLWSYEKKNKKFVEELWCLGYFVIGSVGTLV